jgi:hypothetical protein
MAAVTTAAIVRGLRRNSGISSATPATHILALGERERMSYRLGQHLSEGHRQDDPLKDRVWLALQTFVTFGSLFLAFGKMDDWGSDALAVGAGLLILGTSVLYLAFIRGPWTRWAIVGTIVGLVPFIVKYAGFE